MCGIDPGHVLICILRTGVKQGDVFMAQDDTFEK